MAKDGDWVALGERVKARREVMRLGQSDLVARGGPSDYTLRKIERGEPGPYRSQTMTQLEEALDWPAGTVDLVLDGDATEEQLAAVVSRPVQGLAGARFGGVAARRGPEEMTVGELLNSHYAHRGAGVNEALRRFAEERALVVDTVTGGAARVLAEVAQGAAQTLDPLVEALDRQLRPLREVAETCAQVGLDIRHQLRSIRESAEIQLHPFHEVGAQQRHVTTDRVSEGPSDQMRTARAAAVALSDLSAVPSTPAIEAAKQALNEVLNEALPAAHAEQAPGYELSELMSAVTGLPIADQYRLLASLAAMMKQDEDPEVAAPRAADEPPPTPGRTPCTDCRAPSG